MLQAINKENEDLRTVFKKHQAKKEKLMLEESDATNQSIEAKKYRSEQVDLFRQKMAHLEGEMEKLIEKTNAEYERFQMEIAERWENVTKYNTFKYDQTSWNGNVQT